MLIEGRVMYLRFLGKKSIISVVLVHDSWGVLASQCILRQYMYFCEWNAMKDDDIGPLCYLFVECT